MTEVNPTTAESFAEAVSNADGPVVILFTAPTWCVPCQRFEPHWIKAQETLTDYTFVKVDMGATPEDTGQHWASAEFNILGVPQVKRVIGEYRGAESLVDVKSRAVLPLIRELTDD